MCDELYKSYKGPIKAVEGSNRLTPADYFSKAMAMKVYGAGSAIVYPALGLNGEAGEVAEKVKKVLRDNGGVFTDEAKEEIAKELGDCLWYICALADDMGYTLNDIAQMNVDKLTSRKNRDMIHGNGDNR